MNVHGACAAVLVGAALALGSAGCGGGGGGGGGAPAPTSSGTGGTSGAGGTSSSVLNAGSQFWHENDTLGQPLKTHSASEQSAANEVLTLVNQERANAGLPALAFDADAAAAAKVHAEDMVGRGYFSHNSPEGWSPGDRLQMVGASGYSGWGENIAQGQSTPQSVMTAWMNSSGHRANILNSSYTHLGVGYDEGSRTWVQVFLRR
ncbi:MAG: CAP domain-containing protein [Planctomycetota bacterium]